MPVESKAIQKREDGGRTAQAEGVVDRVDPVARELAAWIGNDRVTVYVPPGCEVTLRGERVKLRLVQPGDRVRIAFAAHGEPADFRIARQVEVQPARRPPVLSR